MREEKTMKFTTWMEEHKGRKIIITDRVRNGNRLIRKYNIEQKKDSVFTTCMTLSQIAEELLQAWNAYQQSEEPVTVLDSKGCVYLLDEIIKKNQYHFVPKESFCINTTETILKSMNQIRMNQPKGSYETAQEQKIVELKHLISVYEAYLRDDKKVYDYCTLLKKGTEILEASDKEMLYQYLTWTKGCQFGRLEDLELTVCEENFLNQLLGSLDVSAEKLTFFTDVKSTENYRFFHAYGIVNEVRYVIEDILNKKYPFDKVNISYTSGEYEPFIRSGLESRGIPCHFVTGESAAKESLIQLLTAVLTFAEEDFLYSRLKDVVENPLINFSKIKNSEIKGEMNVQRCYQKFIREGIGWGKQRYLECIDWVKKNEKKKEDYAYFLEFLSDLLHVFEEEHSCKILYRRLLAFASKYTTTADKEKNQLLADLKDNIEIFDQLADQDSQSRCISLILEHLKTVTVERTPENQAAVNATRIQNLEVLERPYQYVVGLSAKQFQSDTTESPVLSDAELEEYLEGKLRLSKENGKKLYENMERSFKTLEKGEIIMGYSTFDTISLKESSPSVFYLIYKDRYAKEKEPEYCSYILPKNAIKIADHVEETKEADKAAAEVKMSPSALQTLINCPLEYYYQYEKHIPKVQFQEKSAFYWLDSANKGNLFHRTLEKYCNDFLCEKEVYTGMPDESEFRKIYLGVVEELQKEQACTSEEVYNREIEEYEKLIWEYLSDFYEELKRDFVKGKKWRILKCEYQFEDISFEINFSNEETKSLKVLLYGFIDRMDAYLTEDGHLKLRVIDYKTGNRDKKETAIKTYEQIQHIVYAKAAKLYAEEHRNELESLFDAKITAIDIESAYYIFPYGELEDRILDPVTIKELNLSKPPLDLPESVKKALWKTLGEKDYGEKEHCCDYCVYQRQCRRKLGTEL